MHPSPSHAIIQSTPKIRTPRAPRPTTGTPVLPRNPNLEATGQLQKAEVETLWAYQRATGARSVKFGGWATNFGFDPDVASCTSADDALTLSPATPFGISGIKPGAKISGAGLYRCGNVSSLFLLEAAVIWNERSRPPRVVALVANLSSLEPSHAGAPASPRRRYLPAPSGRLTLPQPASTRLATRPPS
jgi:hypothetical protein